MVKKLKDLKARLGELQGPEDNTVATKNFYKKHKTVEHPDPAGNGDDVFKASNVRTVRRSPNHGYDPGGDAAVYEGYDDIDTDQKEVRRLLAKATRKRRDADSLKDDHRSSRVAMGNRLSDEADEHEAEAKKLMKRSGNIRPKSSIDEVFGLSKKEKAEKIAKKIMNGPNSPWSKAEKAKDEVDAKRYYGTLKQSYDPRIYDIFAHLSEENKELFLQVLGEEDGYERIAEAFGLTEEE